MYVKAINNQIPVGTRFKMRFNMDDSPERRFSGVVTGISDLDAYRWPNSKWRCLMVRWDEDIMSNHQERVSPWDIDFSVSFPPLSIQSSPRMKKMRTNLQETPPDSCIAGGALLDFEESMRSSKVLQGQENFGLVPPLYGCNKINRPLDFEMQSLARQNLAPNGIEKNFGEFVRAQPPATYTGFLDSTRFPKVLQGQEICSLKSLTGKLDTNPGNYGKPEIACNVFNMYQRPKTNFYPLASEGIRNVFFPYSGIYRAGQDPVMLSYMSNIQRESPMLNTTSIQSRVTREEGRKQTIASDQSALEKISKPSVVETHLKNENNDTFNNSMAACKLFGFSLTKEPSMLNSQSSGKRSCTKVHKQGNMVGRAIDLSRLNGYDDLLVELERLFSMEGLLRDPNKGWRILYTDSENDMMVVGDDPWHEFCEVVSKIHIYTQEEVEKMTIGMTSDDTQSCLEEAPPVMDASKSSSVGQPDSSPTVIRI